MVGTSDKEAVRCHAVMVDKSTQQAAGFLLMLGIFAAAGLALGVRKAVRRERVANRQARASNGQARARNRAVDRPWRFESVFASMVAYGFYVAAALWAGAEFPKFLQDHLFDGLAPAALVGVLVSLLLRDDPRTILPWIRWPWMILVLFLISGALISGLIAAAAIFSSATNNYGSGIAFVRPRRRVPQIRT